MTDKAFTKQEIIDSNLLNPNMIACPKCEGRNLVLQGQAQLPQQDVMENGVVTASIVGQYSGGAFSLESVDCMNCNIQFIIKDHEIFRLEIENSNLKLALAKYTKNNKLDH